MKHSFRTIVYIIYKLYLNLILILLFIVEKSNPTFFNIIDRNWDEYYDLMNDILIYFKKILVLFN